MNGKKGKKFWMGTALLLLILLFAVSIVTAQMAGQTYSISSSTMNSGGGRGSSPSYSLQNSTGQAMPAGISQSPSFGVYAGFQPTTMEELPTWVPCIRSSAELVDWGTVQIEHQSQRILTIYNDGLATLEISQVTSDHPCFTCTPEVVTVAARGSEDITITFTPDCEETMEATLTIVCNDPDEPTCCVTLRGAGTEGCAGGDPGDVNGDGGINVLDVLAVANHILGIVILDGDALCRADCNGDETINILDALNIANVILGIIPECPSFGGCKLVVTTETMEFFKALEPYFTAEEYSRLMALIKPDVQLPVEYSLEQNYPNPFNPKTDIRYQIPDGRSPLHTSLKVYNLLGQEMRTLVDDVREPGFYTVTWNGRDRDGRQAASGVYFYQLSVDGGRWSATKRMMLMK